MKRFIAVILTVCLCLTSVFALASCGENEEEDTRVINTEPTNPDMTDENGFGYVVNDDGKTLSIILYKGTATEIEVPSRYNGQTVTEISKSVFSNSDITTVSIPETVEGIGNRAFFNCQKLVSVKFAEGLKKIDNFAFACCGKLTDIALPSSLKTIGDYAFTASGLKNCTVSAGTEYIGNFAFFQCVELESITVPSTVKEFGNEAFSQDEKLTVYGETGSPVEEYAEEYTLNFSATE